MHAVLTADGQAVPVTYNEETGQYMTQDGQPVIIQMQQQEEEEQQQQQQQQEEEQQQQQIMAMEAETAAAVAQQAEAATSEAITADLSSLAAVAEAQTSLPLQNIRILNADGTLTTLGGETMAQQQIRIINAPQEEEVNEIKK